MSLNGERSPKSAEIPDPTSIGTRAEFAAALKGLRESRLLTIRKLSAETGIPSATLGGYFSGRHLPQVTDIEIYTTMLSALGVPTDRHQPWVETLRRLRSAGVTSQASSEPPFRGLVPFDVSDAAWYFGREEASQHIVARIVRNTSGPRFLALIGASGSGKSSLLRAGVLSRLITDDAPGLVIQPGEAPLMALAETLDHVPAVRYLAIDQFEELFDSRIGAAERDEFIGRITHIANNPGGPFVLIAVRADFYEQCVSDPRLLELFRTQQELVGAMNEAELRRAVTEPAARAGVTVQPEFVIALLKDLAPRSGLHETYDPGLLPLFSHTLLSVWERSDGHTLQLEDYTALGGVAEAIQRTAEGVYGDLDEAQQNAIRRVFDQLVTITDEGIATRRRMAHQDLTMFSEDSTIEAIEAFIRNRILVATEATLEISHEALLFAWPRLAAWIDQDRGTLRVQHRVSEAADAWEEHGRKDGALLRGPLLELAEPTVEGPDARPMREVDRTFLRASLARAREEVAGRRRGEQRLRRLLITSLILAVAAALVSVFLVVAVTSANHERSVAQTQRSEALSRQVAVESRQLRASDPGLAEQLALVAYRLAPTYEARSALLEASGEAPVTRVAGPEGLVRASVDSTGQKLAVASADGAVRIYNRGTGHPPVLRSTTTVGAAALFSGAFSPDGALFAAGDADGNVFLIDLGGAQPRVVAHEFIGTKTGVEDVTFSPDGTYLYAATGVPNVIRWTVGHDSLTSAVTATGFGGVAQAVAVSKTGMVATGSADGTVRLWTSTASGMTQVSQLPDGAATNVVYSVAFSPDGTQLAAASKDKLVRVWTLGAQPQLVKQLNGFSGWVNGVAYSPDGSLLAAVGSNGITQVWRSADWLQVSGVPGPTNFTSVQFTPDGKDIVAGSIDGITRLWPVAGPRLPAYGDAIWGLNLPASGAPLFMGFGPPNPRVSVAATTDRMHLSILKTMLAPTGSSVLAGDNAVSPDGSLLVAGTASGDLVVFPDASSAGGVPLVVPAATALIENVVFSPDGSLVAAASDDGSVTVFAVHGAQLTRVRQLNVGAIAVGLTFSPDGSTIAVGDADKLIHLFDARSGALTAVLTGFTNYVNAIAYSPDGHTLAAAGSDRTVRLWDIRDRAHPRPLGSPLSGPGDVLDAVSWLDNGSMIAAPSDDGKVWIWTFDGHAAHPYASLGNLGAGVTQLTPMPNSSIIFAAGFKGMGDSWDTNVDEIARSVCTSAGTPITQAEWAQYVPGVAYNKPC